MAAITTDVEHSLLIGTPMSNSPYTVPRATLASLSEDAQFVARHVGQRLERDVFGDRPNRYVTREEAEAFKPTTRMLDAFAELEAAGLALYEPRWQSLYQTRIHPLYTYAFGRGSQFIRVTTFTKHPQQNERLLVVLIGGDLESKDNSSGGIPTVDVKARHDTGTDVEHDASSTAVLTVLNPTQPVFTLYGHMKFHGVLGDVHLYPFGTDIESVEDPDSRRGGVCTRCEEPHHFLPYQPPRVDELAGQFVTVEAVPFRPYLVRDLSQPYRTHRDRGPEDED